MSDSPRAAYITLEDAVLSIGLPTLGHVLEAATDHRFVRYAGQGTVVGRVVTVRLTTTDSTMVHYVTTIVRPGDFVVIQASDLVHAPFGGVIAASFAAAGVVGVAVDGACTDLEGLRSSGLSVYARGTSALTTRRERGDVQGEVNGPITVGFGQATPGMIALGDDHGVLFATEEDVRSALGFSADLAAAEPHFLSEIRAGRSFGEVYLDPELIRELDERWRNDDV